MMSAIIFVCCFGAAGQFLVAYCRTLLAGSDSLVISDHTREVAGIHGKTLDPCEFNRLLGLARMTGIPAADTTQLRAVKSYYRILSLAERLLCPRVPPRRCNGSMRLPRCTDFAAVVVTAPWPGPCRQLAPTSAGLGSTHTLVPVQVSLPAPFTSLVGARHWVFDFYVVVTSEPRAPRYTVFPCRLR